MALALQALFMDVLRDAEVLSPLSRHSLHVTEPADLPESVGVWTREQLYAAVTAADPLDRVVVLDYGRGRLYLAADARYRGPVGLGLLGPPALTVADPRPVTYRDGNVETGEPPEDSLVVTPEFDVLVPAFDFPEDEPLPPALGRRRGRPTGHGTPTG